MAKNLIVALTLFISFLDQAHSASSVQCARFFDPNLIDGTQDRKGRTFMQIDVSKGDPSKLFRSNSIHFWDWARRKWTSLLRNVYEGRNWERFFNPVGYVGGDGHLGNFLPTAMFKYENGQFKDFELEWIYSDLDDSGVGSFAADIARFAASVKLISEEIKIRSDILPFYVKGLMGQRMPKPDLVKEILDLSKDDYFKEQDDYIDRKTKKNNDGTYSFKFQEGEIEKVPLHRRARLKREIEKILTPDTVYDIGTRPKERGGSMASQRYWALVKRPAIKKGNRISIPERIDIVEFKELADPGVKKFIRQDWSSNRDRHHDLMELFWYEFLGMEESDPNYKIVELNGSIFLQRPKKMVDIMQMHDVDFDDIDKDKRLKDLMMYAAFTLGRMHGMQGESPNQAHRLAAREYVRQVAENEADFFEAVREFTRQYRELVESATGERG